MSGNVKNIEKILVNIFKTFLKGSEARESKPKLNLNSDENKSIKEIHSFLQQT